MRVRAAVLIEAVVALAALIPIVIILIGIFPYAYSVDQTAWQRVGAQDLAVSALAQARQHDFDSLVSSTSQAQLEGIDYTVDLTVTPTPTTGVARKKAVLVQVSWQTPRRREVLAIETRLVRL